jgi:hypothetical protein
MDVDIPRTPTIGIETNPKRNYLSLRLWESFQPIEVIDIRSFTYDSKTGRIL